MDEQILDKYIELVNALKGYKDEMKPLRKEKKEIEEMLVNSGKTEFTHYGVKITIEPRQKEKINKASAESLITKAVHNGEGKFEDYYDITNTNKITVKEMAFNSNEDGIKAI